MNSKSISKLSHLVEQLKSSVELYKVNTDAPQLFGIFLNLTRNRNLDDRRRKNHFGRETRESRQVCSSWAYKRQMGTLGQLRDDLRQQKTANVFKESVKIYFICYIFVI